ncbi:MAG TPA: tetratricopeptide repeat protein, partial [Pirellulaceae bacterium]|nr:tetratricopeptide repeat protein [Pirellulaceae bacterium]
AAEKAFTESITLFSTLREQFPEEASYRQEQANTRARYAAFLSKAGDNAAARREYEEAVTMLEAVVKAAPTNVAARMLLATEYNNLGIVVGRLGGDPLPDYQKSIAIRQQLVAQFPDERGYRYDLSVSEMNLSTLHLRQERYAEAERVLRRCLHELEQAPATLQTEAEYRRALAAAHLNLGYALEHQAKPTEAAAAYLAGVKVLERLVELYPQSVAARTMLIDALNNLSKLRIAQGEYAAAVGSTESVVAIYRQLVEEFPEETSYATLLAARQKSLEQLRRIVMGLPPE